MRLVACGRRGFLRARVRDLVLRKAIGLEIGEAPPGIAEARSGARRHLVGCGRLLLPSEGLEGVAERHVQIGGPVNSWRYSAIACGASRRPCGSDRAPGRGG